MYIRNGVGEPTDFLYKSDSLVDRIPAEDGLGKDCHVFAGASLGADLVVQVHFFSQPVGPAFPTFVVKLGRRPEALPPDWRSVHVAAYTIGVAGPRRHVERTLLRRTLNEVFLGPATRRPERGAASRSCSAPKFFDDLSHSMIRFQLGEIGTPAQP